MSIPIKAQTQMLVVPLGKGPNAGQEDLPPAGTGIEGKAFVFVSGNDLVIIINGDPVTLYDVANDTEPKLWDDLVPPFGSLGHKNVEEVEVHRLHTPAIYRKEYVDRLIRREVTERQTPLPRRNLAFFNPADEQTVIDALLLSIRNGTEPAFLSAWATRLTARGSHLIEDQSLPLAYCTDTTLPSPSEIDSPYPSFVTRTDVISLSHSPSCIFDLDSLNDLIRTGEITADMRRVDTHITSIGTRCEDKLLIRELATTSQHDEMTRWWKDLRAADPHVRRDSNMTIVGLLAHTPDDVVAFIIHIKSKVLALYYSKDTSLGPFVESYTALYESYFAIFHKTRVILDREHLEDIECEHDVSVVAQFAMTLPAVDTANLQAVKSYLNMIVSQEEVYDHEIVSTTMASRIVAEVELVRQEVRELEDRVSELKSVEVESVFGVPIRNRA